MIIVKVLMTFLRLCLCYDVHAGMKLRGADFANAMRACLRGGQAEAVPRLYREMKKVGIKPNQLCHLTLLKVRPLLTVPKLHYMPRLAHPIAVLLVFQALVEIGRAKEALEVWYALSTTSLPGQSSVPDSNNRPKGQSACRSNPWRRR